MAAIYSTDRHLLIDLEGIGVNGTKYTAKDLILILLSNIDKKDLLKDILYDGGLDCLKELEEVIIPQVRQELINKLREDEDNSANYEDDSTLYPVKFRIN